MRHLSVNEIYDLINNDKCPSCESVFDFYESIASTNDVKGLFGPNQNMLLNYIKCQSCGVGMKVKAIFPQSDSEVLPAWCLSPVCDPAEPYYQDAWLVTSKTVDKYDRKDIQRLKETEIRRKAKEQTDRIFSDMDELFDI